MDMRTGKAVLAIVGTFAILALVHDTLAQVILFLAWWALMLWPLSRAEWILAGLTCVGYIAADIVVTRSGVFTFAAHDVWGLPYYEPLVWGFYFLHAQRLLRATPPRALRPTHTDLLYAGYFIVLGIIIESIGTSEGLWTYHIAHPLVWWILTWALSGLILYRLALPVSVYLARHLHKK